MAKDRVAAGTLIIGLGQIGMTYDLGLNPDEYIYTHARAFSLHPAFNLVAGVDPDQHIRAQFGTTYHCPAYASIDDIDAGLTPQLVVIAVPTELHAETIDSVLSRFRPAAILCEKPLAYDIEQARMILDLCQAANVALYVNYMRRSDPGAVTVRQRLITDEIVSPIKGVAWYTKGFMHNGSHLFNLLEYWLGNVTGTGLINRERILDTGDVELDARVVFEHGQVMFLAAREDHYSHYTIELIAANGRLRYEQGGRQIQWQRAIVDKDLTDYSFLSSETEYIEADMKRYQWQVATELSRALVGDEANLCHGSQALGTLENMQALLEAAL